MTQNNFHVYLLPERSQKRARGENDRMQAEKEAKRPDFTSLLLPLPTLVDDKNDTMFTMNLAYSAKEGVDKSELTRPIAFYAMNEEKTTYTSKGGKFALFEVKGPHPPMHIIQHAHQYYLKLENQDKETISIAGHLLNALKHNIARNVRMFEAGLEDKVSGVPGEDWASCLPFALGRWDDNGFIQLALQDGREFVGVEFQVGSFRESGYNGCYGIQVIRFVHQWLLQSKTRDRELAQIITNLEDALLDDMARSVRRNLERVWGTGK